MNTKAPGKGLLKVVGIILIVFGVFAFISAGSSVLTLNVMEGQGLDSITSELLKQQGITEEAFRQSLQLGMVLSGIQGVLYLAAGILGIVNCNKIKKASVCFICGIVLIAWQLGNAVYGAVAGGFTVISLISVILGLILPLLYFWGAVKNRQAMQNDQ